MDKLKHRSSPCILSSPLSLYILLIIFHQIIAVGAQNAQPATIRVGVVLDLDTKAGKRSKTAIEMSIEEFYARNTNFKTRVILEYRDSSSDVVSAASAALDLLKNEKVQAIMGPQTSTETEFVANMCNRSQVPLLSFSASSPSISPSHLPFFIRANINDSSQSIPIAAFVKYFNWHAAVPIYEDSDYGSGIVPSLVDALQSIDVDIPDRVVIPTEATNELIDTKLYRLKTLQTRVFIVHMLPPLASRLFLRAEAIGMMSNEYIWIVTDSVGNVFDTLDSNVIRAMEGVIGFRTYVAPSNEINSFSMRFKTRLRQDNPGIDIVDPNVYQFWAYDAVQAMAWAIEMANVTNSSFVAPQIGATDLSMVGVSQTGTKLLHKILDVEFDGLAGKFKLVDGQLQLFAFEIVNAVGKSTRSIGFWTPNEGIIREINSSIGSGNDNNILKSIIWPGDPREVPKGWDIPTEGPKLRVGVPVKTGFFEFVNIPGSTEENKPTHGVTGFCIDVFEAALRKLPYALRIEYYPFNSKPYDSLVEQVYLKKFDIVVGDITIRFNRTKYVDFTLPFTESGVSMVVPIQQDASKNTWIFLEPLDRSLWLVSMSFFLFTGFVVWVIEHRMNLDFRGTLSQQCGLIFYFAFSTLVFAHKEKLESNFSRFMMIIWLFVVLILTSSYTASLTSMLTVQQLKPIISDMSQLIKQGDYVGYQNTSFVGGLLTSLGIEMNKLKPYKTPDEFAEALDKGSANGGVTAIFAETPYLKVFLSRYCQNYTMVGPVYKTDGFGFGFPIGSPLLPDMSRAILSVTEGREMTEAENKWNLGKSVTCPSQSMILGTSSLSLHSFIGLFKITGIVSVLMLLGYLAMSIIKDWSRLLALVTPDHSLFDILFLWCKHFDSIDWDSPSLRYVHRAARELARPQLVAGPIQVGLLERLRRMCRRMRLWLVARANEVRQW